MTMVASPQELHDAILSNSSELINSYLKDGADPNVSPRLKAINGDHQVNEFDKVVGFHNRHQAVLSPLHVAIIKLLPSSSPSYDADDTKITSGGERHCRLSTSSRSRSR